MDGEERRKPSLLRRIVSRCVLCAQEGLTASRLQGQQTTEKITLVSFSSIITQLTKWTQGQIEMSGKRDDHISRVQRHGNFPTATPTTKHHGLFPHYFDKY